MVGFVINIGQTSMRSLDKGSNVSFIDLDQVGDVSKLSNEITLLQD